MRGHIDVEDAAASILDDKETVQNAEGHGRHGEEVEGDDRLAVVANKGQPPLGWITSALDRPQIACDGPLGEHEAELLQFAVDLRRAPIGVLLCQTPNQAPNLLADPRPAATRPRFPTPIQSETGPCQAMTVSALRSAAHLSTCRRTPR